MGGACLGDAKLQGHRFGAGATAHRGVPDKLVVLHQDLKGTATDLRPISPFAITVPGFVNRSMVVSNGARSSSPASKEMGSGEV